MKVVLIIPCYNSIKYIDSAINSALAQDYDNLEIHAYDNESTDGSYEHLLKLEKEHERLTVHQVPNIYKWSYREAVDHSFENLDFDYITFLASDDYLAPDYISKCMKIISHNPTKIKCIQSGIYGVQNDKTVSKQLFFYKNMREFKHISMDKCPVNSPTVVYHKSLYKFMKWTPYGGEAHKHNEIQEAGAGDYDIFCGFAENNIFIFPVNAYLGYHYRWHPEQCTWGVQQESIKYDKIIQEYWRNKWNL